MRARLALLFVLALVARLVAAATSSLYVDEAFGFFMSRHDFVSIILGARPDNNPPLWYFLVHPLSASVPMRGGPEDLAGVVLLLRLPSCILGALAAPVTYLIGRRFGERVGLWSAGMVVVAYTSWLADGQTRAYGLVTLLAALALWMVLELRDSEQNAPPGGWSGLTAVAVTLPLLHFLGLLVNVALLGSCVLHVRYRGRTALCFSAGIAAGLAWIVYAATNPASGLHPRSLATSGAVEALTLPGYISGLLMPLNWSFVPRLGAGSCAALTYLISAGVGALCLWGLRCLVREKPAAAWTLGLFVIVPVLGIVAGALGGFQLYQNRYLVPISSGLFLLMAVAAARVRLQALLAVMVACNIATLAVFPVDRYLWNQDWASAARFIMLRETPGDVTVAYIPYSLIGLDFYYHPGKIDVDFSNSVISRRYASGYGGTEQLAITPAMLNDDLARSVGRRRVFLLFNQADAKGQAAIATWFNNLGYRVGAEFQQSGLMGWGNITIYQLVPPDIPGPPATGG